MARIKFTGWIPVEDLFGDEYDPESGSGLTEQAYLKYVAGETGYPAWSTNDFEEYEVELEKD